MQFAYNLFILIISVGAIFASRPRANQTSGTLQPLVHAL